MNLLQLHNLHLYTYILLTLFTLQRLQFLLTNMAAIPIPQLFPLIFLFSTLFLFLQLALINHPMFKPIHLNPTNIYLMFSKYLNVKVYPPGTILLLYKIRCENICPVGLSLDIHVPVQIWMWLNGMSLMSLWNMLRYKLQQLSRLPLLKYQFQV